MPDQRNSVQDQVNLVGEGTVFEGTVRAENDVRTSGQIVGTLEVEGKALVAESGVVEGEIVATNADIAGRVEGEIQVEERLVLKSTARVDGNIETDRLIVEEGAQFSGECEMGGSFSVNGKASEERSSPRGTSKISSSEKGEPETAEEATTGSSTDESDLG